MTTKIFIEMHATIRVNDEEYVNYKEDYFEEHCLNFIRQVCSIFHGKNAYAILGSKVAIYSVNIINEKSELPSNAYFRFLLPRLEIDDDPDHFIRTAKLVWQTNPCAADEIYFEVI